MNTDHVRNPLQPIILSRPRAPFGMAEAQPADHVRPQFVTWYGVEGGVDGFVRHLQRGVSASTSASVPAICSDESPAFRYRMT